MRTTNRFRATRPVGPLERADAAWKDFLNDKLPHWSSSDRERMYDTHKRGGLGDAYRHRTSAQIASGIIDPLGLGVGSALVEIYSLFTERGETPDNAMDKRNNSEGAAENWDGRLLYSDQAWADQALDFLVDVARGEVPIIDRQTGKARPGRAGDLPRIPDERPYRPDINRVRDPTTTNDVQIA